MKTRLFGYVCLIFLTHLLFSCDPAICYQYYLNNSSDSLLNVKFKIDKDGPYFFITYILDDSILHVSPKSEVLIFKTCLQGSNPHDEKNDFLKLFDILEIYKSDIQSPIKKDIRKRENWRYDSIIQHLGIIRTGHNIYRLKLTNEDI